MWIGLLEVIDFCYFGDVEWVIRLVVLIDVNVLYVFDFVVGVLLCCMLVRYGDVVWMMLLNIYYIVFDGSLLVIFCYELWVLYVDGVVVLLVFML